MGGAKAIVAGGAPLEVNGVKVGNLNASGTLTVSLTSPWTAQIPTKKKIAASEKLAG